jgi:hypothetical protein
MRWDDQEPRWPTEMKSITSRQLGWALAIVTFALAVVVVFLAAQL